MTADVPSFPPLKPRDPADIGGYRTVGRLGAGGMGAVYAARSPAGELVAVKLVHGDLAADPDFRARFRREADLVGRVVGPCVPRFLAQDTDADQPWLVTEYVSGPTLRQHVREHGPLSGAPLHAFATGIAEALRAIHAAGIVHRDLKPGNVILAPDGPKVLDFGIARAIDETAITSTGGLFGTPGWVAPELLRGSPPSVAADVFAWGGLVAYAATGRSPFGTGSAETMAVRVLDGEPDLAGVPEALMPLVRAATGQDPNRRPTVEQALAELLCADQATVVGPGPEATELVTRVLREGWEAPPPPTVFTGDPAPRRRPRRRRPWLPAGAAVSALVLVAAGVWVAGDRFAEEPVETGETGEVADAGAVEQGVGEQVAVEIASNGLFMVHADPNGTLDITPGFDGAGSALPEGVDRAESVVASVNVGTVFADVQEQSGVQVFGELEYLAEEGEFTLRAGDLGLLEVGDDWDPLPDDPTADGRPAHTADPDDVLVTVSPDSPDAEFAVDFADAPQSGLLTYLPAANALGGEAEVAGVYTCYMNWHPYPPVDMTDEEYVPCPAERPE
ncbi:serine/threonine-protein kinase [Nocardiopsis sp. JB363]|uniref:serine/threonine-protein kinase n=1 Tax=Nocardiopsis sp. JB363 TaxID=1434837 RepID=UPI00097B035E|nr:serine/threonine-protein kinase [Nocardiopsis sp. JB363]SIO87058.1 serine/threonine protein kinase [Nocardiopsis sp. JB363]